MKSSDHIARRIKQSIGNDINAGSEKRTRAAELLAELIHEDYPNMSWQDCQYHARQAVNYER
jgi:hypothetical protein